MNRFLSLYLPRWPVQRWIAARGEHDRAAAVLLYRDRAQQGLRVAACCRNASRQGVRTGMPLAEATSLAARNSGWLGSSPQGDAPGPSASRERSPGASLRSTPATPGEAPLEIDRYDPAADRLALQRLAVRCDRFSPSIGLEEIDPPAGLLMDVSSLDKLFGSEQALARQLAGYLQQMGLVCRIAIAGTIGMAWGLARFGERAIECLDPDNASRTDSLPVEALRLEDRTAAMLHRLGIDRVGELLALPRRQLRSRFGEELLMRLWQWRGEIPEVIRPVASPLTITAETNLEYVVSDRAAIGHLLGELLREIAAKLEEQRLGATQLECRLRSELGESATLRIGCCRPTTDPERMRQLLLLQLESTLVPEGIESLSLRVVEHVPLESYQTELFGEAALGEPKELGRLIDKLSTRLGQSRVTRPRLAEEYLPEKAYVAAGAAAAADSGRVGYGYAARPLILLDPPEPVRTIVLDRRSLPREFVYRQQPVRVAGCSQRETIETGWWRGPTVRREYHRVQTTSGSKLWLFRRIDDGSWFVQGEFL